MAKETLLGVATSAVLPPGATVSGRFVVEGLRTQLGPVCIYAARDQRTQRPVGLWAIPAGIIGPDVINATRAAVKAAAGAAHKDLVVPFGSSTDATGTLFIASEPIGQTSARDLIDRKRAEGHVHGLAAAYSVLAHAMNGLVAAHAVLAHGAVSPELIRIDEQGHVKLAGLGLLAPLVMAGSVRPEYVAPEVRAGSPPTAQSDIFSLGAVLYEMCTGFPPDPSRPATSLVEGLPATFDIIIENCLADSPADRFESVTEMKGALASLVAPTIAPPPSEALDVPIEFDVEIDVSAAVAAAPPRRLTIPPGTIRQSTRPGAPHNAPPAGGYDPMAQGIPPPAAAPQIGSRVSMVGEMPAPVSDNSRLSSVDLKGLLDAATTDDAQRWMFVRGGLDHGPLSARELIQSIIRNDVMDDDVVFNMDSGERRKLGEWPQYREFAEQAREKRKRVQHQKEVKGAIRDDAISIKAKGAVAVALVMVVAIIGVVYYKTLGPGRAFARRQAEFEAAVARGQLHLASGGLQVLEAPTSPPPGSTTRRAHSGGGGGGFQGSYEAAMNAPIEFNFGSGNMGGGVLNDREIAGPLNAALGRFGSCATAELARGGAARNVSMRIAVGGNGSAIGLSVPSGSGAFRSCVGGVVRGIRWRAFGGPRMGFSWGFSLQ